MNRARQDQLALRLFETVAEMPPDERRRYLEERCEDSTIRSKVLAMLAADAQADGLLESDPREFATHLTRDGEDTPLPQSIGPYRVLERVGQGGMAVVYKAKRADGEFEQLVALKIIPPAQLTPQWRDRFLQERQILASLNHPNIARLLDGGLADDATPYFALEYVDGLPITQYCDENRLTVEHRLKLMVEICHAVGYAHRNLVVHRDLKPSNILVDEHGAAKLLDFGIAKLLGEHDASLTMTGHRALTPGYAAPEQFLADSITTATDVYALGVLLYELLLGARPHRETTGSTFDLGRDVIEHRLRSVRQLAQQLDPPARTSIAAARRTTWPRLQRSVAGDLEVIAFKAMHREPERRYASAEAMADDIRRAMSAQPVEARPDSRWYRLRKFVRRHRGGVTAGTLVAVALIATTAIAAYQSRQANRESMRAAQTRDFLRSLFEYASPDRSLGDRLTARQLLDRGAARVSVELRDTPELQAEIMQLLADTYVQLGVYDQAEDLATRARDIASTPRRRALVTLTAARAMRLDGQLDDAESLLEELRNNVERSGDPTLQSALYVELGELTRERADYDAAERHLSEALRIDELNGAPATDIGRDLYRLATLMVSRGENDRALALFRQTSDIYEQAALQESTQYASVRHDLGVLLIQRGELDEARAVLEDVQSLRERLLGQRHPDRATTIKEIAGLHRLAGELDRAEAMYLSALDIYSAVLDPNHQELANLRNSLAVLYRQMGENEKALQFALQALEGARSQYGPQHPTVGIMTSNVAGMQREAGQLRQAQGSAAAALENLEASVGTDHQLYAVALNVMAAIKRDVGDLEGAQADLSRAIPIFETAAGEEHPHLVKLHASLARVLVARERFGEARYHFRRAAEIGASTLPADHLDLMLVRAGLAGVDAAEGRCDVAQPAATRALADLEGAGQADHPAYLEVRDALNACATIGSP